MSYGFRLWFSAPYSHSAQRHCYVRSSALDQLLDTPGVLQLLLEELAEQGPPSSSVLDQLSQLKRHLIHLSVTPSAFRGLSLQEIVVLCAYDSERFNHTAWKHELLAQPSAEAFGAACRSWLRERARTIAAGSSLGLSHWPLVGYSANEPQSPHRFIVGVAPMVDATALERGLTLVGREVGFGHEHYVACTPATALEFVRRSAIAEASSGWDAFALDRRLRSLGLGLLLVEGQRVELCLPARYHAAPMGAGVAALTNDVTRG
jgi:hypothetical protein